MDNATWLPVGFIVWSVVDSQADTETQTETDSKAQDHSTALCDVERVSITNKENRGVEELLRELV